MILRAIDNEIPVRIEAHRSADILNAIDLATEFGLSIIIEGGTEAHLVADQLAEHRIPVILGPGGLPGVYQNNQYRRHSPQAADILSRAGVSFTISSAASGAQASANVALSAQLAISHGQGAGDWMRAVTSDAAKVLGLSGTIGTLAPGTQADLVIWNGDPGAPDARIEWVYVRGRPIYSALAPNGQEED